MKSTNVTPNSDLAHLHNDNARTRIPSPGLFGRVVAILVLAGFLVGTFYSASLASITSKLDKRDSSLATSDRGKTDEILMKRRQGPSPSLAESFAPTVLAALQSSSEMVATYAGDCATPQNVFTVGETVCVKASGVPLGSFFPRRLSWAVSNSTIVRSTAITTDPQTDSLLIEATSLLEGSVFDNRGTWQVMVRNPFFFFPEATATFTVLDPANAIADLGIASTSTPNSVASGSEVLFGLQMNNYGPDNSTNVQFTDEVPENSTFVAFVQLSGPTFSCTS